MIKRLRISTMFIRYVVILAMIVSSGLFVTASHAQESDGTVATVGDVSTCQFSSGAGLLLNNLVFKKEGTKCGGTLLVEYIQALNIFLYRLAIGLAVLMITIGGFQWLVALGNQSKIAQAKDTILQAIFGLVLALTAVLLFRQIDMRFVSVSLNPTISMKPVPCGVLVSRTQCDAAKSSATASSASCKFICDNINDIQACKRIGTKDEATGDKAKCSGCMGKCVDVNAPFACNGYIKTDVMAQEKNLNGCFWTSEMKFCREQDNTFLYNDPEFACCMGAYPGDATRKYVYWFAEFQAASVVGANTCGCLTPDGTSNPQYWSETNPWYCQTSVIGQSGTAETVFYRPSGY